MVSDHPSGRRHELFSLPLPLLGIPFPIFVEPALALSVRAHLVCPYFSLSDCTAKTQAMKPQARIKRVQLRPLLAPQNSRLSQKARCPAALSARQPLVICRADVSISDPAHALSNPGIVHRSRSGHFQPLATSQRARLSLRN